MTCLQNRVHAQTPAELNALVWCRQAPSSAPCLWEFREVHLPSKEPASRSSGCFRQDPLKRHGWEFERHCWECWWVCVWPKEGCWGSAGSVLGSQRGALGRANPSNAAAQGRPGMWAQRVLPAQQVRSCCWLNVSCQAVTTLSSLGSRELGEQGLWDWIKVSLFAFDSFRCRFVPVKLWWTCFLQSAKVWYSCWWSDSCIFADLCSTLFTVVFMNFLYGQPRKCLVAGVTGCVFVCACQLLSCQNPPFPECFRVWVMLKMTRAAVKEYL